MLTSEITVMKRLRENEVTDIKDKCKAWFGGDCKAYESLEICGLCLIKRDANELRRLFAKRYDAKMELNYFTRLEKDLVSLLKRMALTKWLMLTQDEIELVILSVGMELIRYSLNLHLRGLGWGNSGRFEHLVNMVRANLNPDDTDGSGMAVVDDWKITVWNDKQESIPDYCRSHMVHAKMNFKCGFGANIMTKKQWNGRDLRGLKMTEKEIKKRLRVINMMDEKNTVFELPIFDEENGTYDFEKLSWKILEDANGPLIPAKTIKKTFIF